MEMGGGGRGGGGGISLPELLRYCADQVIPRKVTVEERSYAAYALWDFARKLVVLIQVVGGVGVSGGGGGGGGGGWRWRLAVVVVAIAMTMAAAAAAAAAAAVADVVAAVVVL